MKNRIIIIGALCLCAGVARAVPTNLPAPAVVSVTVDTNSALLNWGTNLFTTNLALVRAAGIIAPTNSGTADFVPVWKAAGAVAWEAQSGTGGGGGTNQTPWASPIDGAQFPLTNASSLTAGTLVSTGAVTAAAGKSGITAAGVFYANLTGSSSNNFVAGDPRQALPSSAYGITILGTSNNVSGRSQYSSILGGVTNVIACGTTGGFVGANGANTIGGGWFNYIGYEPTNVGYVGQNFIGGGLGNRIFDDGQTKNFIGAGQSNFIYGGVSAIVGGYKNSIYNGFGGNVANYSFIGGGQGNSINGTGSGHADYSVIPGGINNLITANYSFISGISGTNHYDKCWLWSDGSFGSVATTTGTNQFIILSSGGVGINTNNPGTNALKVIGNVDATGFTINGAPLASAVIATNAVIYSSPDTADTIKLISGAVEYVRFNPTNVTIDATAITVDGKAGINVTNTIYTSDAAGTGRVTNVITITKGLITGWTQ